MRCAGMTNLLSGHLFPPQIRFSMWFSLLVSGSNDSQSDSLLTDAPSDSNVPHGISIHNIKLICVNFPDSFTLLLS